MDSEPLLIPSCEDVLLGQVWKKMISYEVLKNQ
jgi:hypothetical protein